MTLSEEQIRAWLIDAVEASLPERALHATADQVLTTAYAAPRAAPDGGVRSWVAPLVAAVIVLAAVLTTITVVGGDHSHRGSPATTIPTTAPVTPAGARSPVISYFPGGAEGINPTVSTRTVLSAVWSPEGDLLVTTWGSASCPTLPTSVTLRSSSSLQISTAAAPWNDCRKDLDLTETTAVVRVPDGLAADTPVLLLIGQQTLTLPPRSIVADPTQPDLPACAGPPGGVSFGCRAPQGPTLAWDRPGLLRVTTWGSSGCRDVPASVYVTNAHQLNVITRETSTACVDDLTATTSLVPTPYGLDDRGPVSVIVNGMSFNIAAR